MKLFYADNKYTLVTTTCYQIAIPSRIVIFGINDWKILVYIVLFSKTFLG